MKRLFYLFALVAICLFFVQCEQSESTINYIQQISGDEEGHEYVDLGLPSGLKWATCNVGATKPEEYGNYFAWGEIEPKTSYSAENYKWYDISTKNITKYNSKDSLYTLQPGDDAATANWGGAWRMPTKEEQQELLDTTITTCEWINLNGVRGCKVTGPNGNSIFLPAAGYRYMHDNVCDSIHVGSVGYYWSRSLNTSKETTAYEMCWPSDDQKCDYYKRHCGQSVRPVCK